MTENKKPIRSFLDLDVYQRAYKNSILVCKKILPKLPEQEKYNLRNQLRRSSTAIPPLIAEGFAKKHLPSAFKKYLDDAMGEANETIVHLSYCKDLYCKTLEIHTLDSLIAEYNLIGKQLFRLKESWRNFTSKP